MEWGLRALSCLGLDVCVRLVILSRMEQYGRTSTVKSPGLVDWKLCYEILFSHLACPGLTTIVGAAGCLAGTWCWVDG